jgi:hypothetical protein
MTDIAPDLRTKLLTDSVLTSLVGSRIHLSHVPQIGAESYIWLAQSGSIEDDTLDDTPGTEANAKTFDLECISYKSQQEASAIRERVRAVLSKFRGTLGNTTVQGVFVEDSLDEYQPRGLGSDEGAYVQTFRVTVFL